MPEPIYLDHNATTPLLPEVAEAMRACWSEPLLNPASQHQFGRRARHILEDSRDRIAELLGANTAGPTADRVIFTSGGTEANNLAIRSYFPNYLLAAAIRGLPVGQPHLLISAIEHPSIAALAEHLPQTGHSIDRVAVDHNGVISLIDLARLIKPETGLVAAMLANNETGVIQPVAELAALCNKHNVPLHTDASQAAGKLPINFRELGAVTMTIAAHKFGGPLGIGALVVHHDIDLQPQLFGGFQQAGLRPGTEPVALAVGMCRALEWWHAEQHERIASMRDLRDRFERAILTGWPPAQVIGANAERLPHTANIAFIGLDRQALFMALDQSGVACSTGSACASGSSETSPVLVAMGCNEAVLSSALRFSLGATTTAADIEEAARRILQCCNNLRREK
jgi:cysteine desulfurase